jgi:uncharacterized protein YkvS
MAKFDENKEETGLVPVEKRTEEIREEAFPEKKKRLNRKERKALKKRQWEYEKQLVKEGKIARRFRYVPRNSFARILSVCLAFVIGFFGAFGALAGGFAYAGTKAKVNDLLKIANVNTSEIVTEYAAQKSVLDLVTEVADLFKGGAGSMTLGSFDKYTPALSKLLEGVNGQIKELGVDLDLNALKSVKFDSIGKYFSDQVLPNVELEGIVLKLAGGKPNSIVTSLCYKDKLDENGNPVLDENGDPVKVKTTVSDFMGENAVDLLKSVKLAEALGNSVDPENPVLKALLYKANGEMTSVGDMMNDPQGLLKGIALAEVLGVKADDPNADPLMVSILYKEGEDGEKVAVTVGELTEQGSELVKGIALADALKISPDGDPLMVAICYKDGTDEAGNPVKIKNTIADLTEQGSELVKGIALADALGIEENDPDADPIMKALCFKKNENGTTSATTIGDLTTGAQSLINDLEVEALLSVTPDSDPAMLYLAYGTKAEYDEETQSYGNGDYYVEENDDGTKTVVMLEGKSKKTVGDLTAPDADLIGGAKIGDLVKIDDGASGLMKTLANWTIADLTEQDKINGIKLNEILEINDTSSALMQELGGKSLGEMTDQAIIDDLCLGTVLGVEDGDSGLMQALKDKKLGDLKDPSVLDDLNVGQVLGVGDDATGLMAAIGHWTIADLKDQNTIETLKIGDVITGADGGLLGAINGWTLADMKQQSRIERLKISQIIGMENSDSLLLNAISDWRINDLMSQNKINTLTLGDVLSIDADSAKILQKLKDTRLGEFSGALDSVCLGDILDGDLDGNKILKNLKYSTLKTLADDIQDLTVSDVFGEEIYSYLSMSKAVSDNHSAYEALSEENKAKAVKITTGTYAEIMQAYKSNMLVSGMSHLIPIPVEITAQNPVEVYYVHENGAQLSLGWFATNGDRIADESAIVKTGKTSGYLEHRITVEPVYEWKTVSYDPSVPSLPYEGNEDDVQEDDYGFFYNDEQGVRIDLDRFVTGYRIGETVYEADENGDILIEATPYRVYRAADDTLYYVTRAEAELRYYGEGINEPIGSDRVTERYRMQKAEGGYDELDRFFDGVWYLLFCTEDANGNVVSDFDMKVLDISENITGVTDLLNNMSLGKMYAHGFIATNPYQILPERFKPDSLKEYENLNQLSISGVIQYVQYLIGTLSSLPSLP